MVIDSQTGPLHTPNSGQMFLSGKYTCLLSARDREGGCTQDATRDIPAKRKVPHFTVAGPLWPGKGRKEKRSLVQLLGVTHDSLSFVPAPLERFEIIAAGDLGTP